MGISLASRPNRRRLPRDSRLGCAVVVVGGDRVGGGLPGTLDCWGPRVHFELLIGLVRQIVSLTIAIAN